jgi:hypothetical protein
MMHPQTMPSAQSGQIATPHPGATAASIGLNTMGTPQAYPTPVTMPTHQGSQAFQQLTPQQQAAQIGLNINGQPSTGMNALGNLNSVPQGNAGNYVAGLSGPTSFTVNV